MGFSPPRFEICLEIQVVCNFEKGNEYLSALLSMYFNWNESIFI